MRRSVLLLSVLALLAITAVSAQDSSTDGLRDFHRAGYPTMTLFAGTCFIALSIYFGMTHGESDWRASFSQLGLSFLILNALNAIIGVFLIFGPGPNCNIVGFALLVGASMGFYCAYTNLKSLAKASFAFYVAVALSIVGCAPLVNGSSPLFLLDQNSCLQYFYAQDNTDFNRCQDKGFLQLCRTFAMFALFFLSAQVFQLFLLITSVDQLQDAATRAKASAPVAAPNAPLIPSYPSDIYNQNAAAPQQAPYQPPAAGTAPAAGAPGSYQAL